MIYRYELDVALCELICVWCDKSINDKELMACRVEVTEEEVGYWQPIHLTCAEARIRNSIAEQED